jgi:hypothetical protein
MAVSAEAGQSITRLIRAAQDGSSSAVRPLLSGFATGRGRWSWPIATTFGGCWPHGPSRGPSI